MGADAVADQADEPTGWNAWSRWFLSVRVYPEVTEQHLIGELQRAIDMLRADSELIHVWPDRTERELHITQEVSGILSRRLTRFHLRILTTDCGRLIAALSRGKMTISLWMEVTKHGRAAAG